MSRKRPVMYTTVVPFEEELMQRVQHTFSASEILNLLASPITILPSPGPGNRYLIFATAATFTFGTVPYVLNGATNLIIPYVPNQEFLVGLDALVDAVENFMFDPGAQGIENPLPTMTDQPLTVTHDGPVEISGGDGTLLLVIYYAIEPST